MRPGFHVRVTFVLPALTVIAACAGAPACAQSLLGPLGLSMFQPTMQLPGGPQPGPARAWSPSDLPYQGSTRLPDSVGPGPGLACRAAIRAAEQAAAIPNQLMAAIARVESGRREPDGSVDPWPWSINAEGESHIYATKAAAIAAVRGFQAGGMRSIDVGCMQVNLQHHPDAFASLEQAFDPMANATYAAHFLRQLHEQTGTWPTATAWYHSATPELGEDYQRKVMAVLPEEKKRADATPSAVPPAAPASPGGFAGSASGGFNAGLNGGPLTSGLGNTAGRPGGNVAVSGGPPPVRVIPMAQGTAGRGLAAYRAAPIMVVERPVLAPASPPATAPARGPHADRYPGGNPG